MVMNSAKKYLIFKKAVEQVAKTNHETLRFNRVYLRYHMFKMKDFYNDV